MYPGLVVINVANNNGIPSTPISNLTTYKFLSL